MELSGNLWERVVTVGNATGRTFSGVHGNGALTSGGAADVSGWPGSSGTGWKGGSWLNTTTNSATTSDRAQAANTDNTRSADAGGRGVRTISPGIVTDGLVLWLDAGITPSYPGSGNTWSDLSGNNYNGTLTNGPTYSSSNGGSIFFDGWNDYVNLPYTLLSGTGNFSVSVWLKSSASTVGGNVFGNYPAGNLEIFYGTRYIGMWLNNFSTYLGTAPWNTTLPEFTTNFTQIVALRKNTNETEFYINGVLAKTGLSSSTIGSVNDFRMATNTSGSETFIGDISQVSVYNRALSAAEILQNYNAQKARFGL
jgi:hypothetical protein